MGGLLTSYVGWVNLALSEERAFLERGLARSPYQERLVYLQSPSSTSRARSSENEPFFKVVLASLFRIYRHDLHDLHERNDGSLCRISIRWTWSCFMQRGVVR